MISARTLVVLCVLVVLGCDKNARSSKPQVPPNEKPVGSEPDPSSSQPTSDEESHQAPDETAKVVETNGLPELDEALPPLDQERFRLAPPKGWRVAGREKGVLTRFYGTEQAELPRILVRAENSLISEIGVFDEESAFSYADEIASSGEGEKAIPTEVLLIGETYWVQSRKKATYRKALVEVISLVTVHRGRHFSITLEALSDQAKHYEPFLMSVATSLERMAPGLSK